MVHGGKALAKDFILELLKGDSSDMSPESDLDKIYLMVLRDALNGEYKEEYR
jgi:hypothetical protein